MKRTGFKRKETIKKCSECPKTDFKPHHTMDLKSPVCSPKCASNRYFRLEKVKREKKEKAFKQETSKALRDLNRKSLPWQHKQTQKVFNRMRVLEELKWFKDRDLEPTCISCNKPNMDWCCSHLKTVGAQGALRYSEFNTKIACNRYCNMGLSGNINGNKTTRGYLEGLVERFGDEKFKEIIDYCSKAKAEWKWTWQELEEMRKGFAARVRELESLN